MDINITLFIQVLAFLILIALVRRFLWGPLAAAMDAREREIEEGLQAAEEGKKQVEAAEETAREIISQAKQEAISLIESARKREKETLEAARENAHQEAEKIRAAATLEAGKAADNAREALSREVGTLVLAAASRVIDRELSDQMHADIIDDSVKKLVS